MVSEGNAQVIAAGGAALVGRSLPVQRRTTTKRVLATSPNHCPIISTHQGAYRVCRDPSTSPADDLGASMLHAPRFFPDLCISLRSRDQQVTCNALRLIGRYYLPLGVLVLHGPGNSLLRRKFSQPGQLGADVEDSATWPNNLQCTTVTFTSHPCCTLECRLAAR